MNRLFGGPLLVVVLAVAAVVGIRYLPLDGLRGITGADDAATAPRLDGRTAPAPPRPPIVTAAREDRDSMPRSPDATETLDRTAGDRPPTLQPAGRPSAVAEPRDAPAVAAPTAPPTSAGPPPVKAPEVVAKAAPARPVEAPAKTPPVPPVMPAGVGSHGEPAQAPSAAPEPALRVFVEADVSDEADLGRYSASEYAGLLRNELIAVAQESLGAGVVQRGDPNMAFRDRVAEGRAGIDELCDRAQAKRVLFADLTVPTAVFSRIPSAYWPEVDFFAVSCVDGRTRRGPKKRLEPHRLDTFEYQQLFARHARDFIASQGYFLAP